MPPGHRDLLDDLSLPLVIVEGSKGCLAAASALEGAHGSQRVAVVGLLGCWGWSSDHKPTADFAALPVLGREVTILLDADLASNRAVWEAAKQMRDQLKVVKGAASVKVATVPGRGKEGLDDVLAGVEPAQRESVLRRILAEGSEKLGRRPAAKRPAAVCFDADGKFLARVAADALLAAAPMAVTQEMSIAVYQSGVYLNGASKVFNQAAVDLLADDFRMTHLATLHELVVTLLKTQGRVVPEKQDRLLINAANGLVDPLTGTLLPHDPSFISLSQIPIEFDPAAKCPKFLAWIEERLPGQRDALLEVLSTALDPTSTPQRAAFLFGPSRSGKSTILRLAQAIIGEADTSSVTLHQLATNRFAAANVYGARLNVAADLSSAEIRDLSVFKMLTGEDLVTADRKYGQQFKFVNRALFAFSGQRSPAGG